MENKLYSRRRFFFKAPKKINKIKLTIFLVKVDFLLMGCKISTLLHF